MQEINYGKLIKDCRIKSGLTQKQLAELVGVTRRAVEYWELGKNMTINNAERVFAALGMKIEIVKRGEEE